MKMMFVFAQCISAGISQSHHKHYRNKGLNMEISGFTDVGRAGRTVAWKDLRHVTNDPSLIQGQVQKPDLARQAKKPHINSKMILKQVSSQKDCKAVCLITPSPQE